MTTRHYMPKHCYFHLHKLSYEVFYKQHMLSRLDVMSRRLCSKLFTLLSIFCSLKGVYNSLKDLNYRKIERAEDWGTKERVKSLFNLKQTKENVRHVA